MSDSDRKKPPARVGVGQRLIGDQLNPLLPQWQQLLTTPPANDNATPIVQPVPQRPKPRRSRRRQ